ncbi:MAG: TIGR04076 family protein [bacterium]|nr:TIGR04076 family protein [bacterium]
MDEFEKGTCKILNELKDVKCTVIEVKGFCGQGHRVGQEYIIKHQRTPEGICIDAFNSIIPQYTGFVYGVKFPWNRDKNCTYVGCPDSKNCVTFKLEKIKKNI